MVERCPVCADPSSCRGYPHLWLRLTEDREAWLPIHDEVNSAPRYPSLLEMAGSAAMAAAGFAASGFATSDDGEHARRLDICRKCDRYEADAGRCRECGCFVSLKARIAALDCPLGRWSSPDSKPGVDGGL
jgi:hypothetical protein